MRRLLLAPAMGALALPALAQPNDEAGTATQAPPPPCQEEAYRAFDFWLGDWEVFTPDGKKAGENLITSHERGCLLLEEWTSAGGGTGQSYNYYNPAMREWRQVWVSGGAVIDYVGGLTDAGVMALEGTIASRAGDEFPFRGTWTPNEDGSVTQHFQQYDPETEEWKDWFTGLYRRKENATEAD